MIYNGKISAHHIYQKCSSLSFDKTKNTSFVLVISNFAITEEIPSKVEGLNEEEGTNQKKTWFYRPR